MTIFAHSHPNLIESTSSCPEFVPAWKCESICVKLYQVAKNQFDQFFLEIQSMLRVKRPDWSNSFLTMSQQKLFNQLLIFVNLYQHKKNEAEKMLDLKILQSESLRAFWHISQEQHFFLREDFYWNTANTDFHYRTNPGKINDQMSL